MIKVIELTKDNTNRPESFSKKVLDLIGKHDMYYFLNMKNGEVISCAVVTDFKNMYGISMMYTNPEYRELGEGKKVMEAIHNKFKGIFILTSQNAGEFYKKIGYVKVNDFYIYSNKEGVVYW